MEEPKLRTADKIRPPYSLGHLPQKTILRVAADIVYLLYTREEARLEGNDWEQIFASAIGAQWKPSNIGLDDVQLDNCCWGAKTVKNNKPDKVKRVRLISGRNSLDFSYGVNEVRGLPPFEVGEKVLGIWNTRVSSVRQRFAHCRTVVLIKGEGLNRCAVFETETIRFDPELYVWRWNKGDNLEGYDGNNVHKFTWQPHGSQFTIIEEVPESRLAFEIKLPHKQPKDVTLKAIGFDDSWVKML